MLALIHHFRLNSIIMSKQQKGAIDMSKAICDNCGEPMLKTYTKRGLRLYVCIHNNAKSVSSRTGRIIYGLVSCNADVFGLKTAFKNQTENTSLTIDQLRDVTQNINIR